MKIKRMKVSDLNTAEYNPRLQLTPDMPEFERLKQSITEFGNVEPIVFNLRTGNVVGGNQRLAVLKEMGIIETDVSVIDMPIEQEKLLNVALNKVKGDWDYDKLPELLKEFDIEEVKLSGFSSQELAILCADINAAIESVEEYDNPDFELEHAPSNDAPRTEEKTRETDFIPKRPEDNMINTISASTPSSEYLPEPEVENYVISLIFDNVNAALNWLATHGLDKQYRQGTHSSVIRIE